MVRTAREQATAYDLIWSLMTGDNGDVLKLDYAITAREELYVGDLLWDYDEANKMVADKFGVYRFVNAGSLRLVFAQAPHAPNMMPRVVYAPLYSRVRRGETHSGSVTIALPVEEYSSLARDIAAPASFEEVSRVILVMSYRTRATMDSDPQLHSKASKLAGYVVHGAQPIVSEMTVEKLPVKRRTGYIARFPLPGEPGPSPMPMPQ